MSEEPTYQPGDCIAELCGEFELSDGRTFTGAILTFPNGPPALALRAVWERLPLTLRLRDET